MERRGMEEGAEWMVTRIVAQSKRLRGEQVTGEMRRWAMGWPSKIGVRATIDTESDVFPMRTVRLGYVC